MAFTDAEIEQHLQVLEQHFWRHRRPPSHLREQMREGQRIQGQSIEIFFQRPAFQRPGQCVEDAVAKLRCVRARGVWQLFRKRADGRWHRYDPVPETASLAEALQIINEDAWHCFFG